MAQSAPAQSPAHSARSLATPPTPARSDHHLTLGEEHSSVPAIGITIYGCGQDEAVRFQEVATRYGVTLTITEAALSDTNTDLALGNRCISIDHKTSIANCTLLALRKSGVRYLSTRSVGCNHLNVEYAESIGIAVGNVMYSPDSVADYTLMLMLMLLRHARSIITRAEIHDYRLHDQRGKELRDLTVGVIGTGRIGAAVVERLRPFGCQILASDPRRKISADHVSMDELLQWSDLVTLHTPLSPDTYHLLSDRHISHMKQGSFIVNTGRGALLDTEALLRALESGRIGAAALDVLEGEEGVFYADYRHKTIESKLLLRLHQLPNVLITPHTAYYTEHALGDMVEHSVINCLKFEGRNP